MLTDKPPTRKGPGRGCRSLEEAVHAGGHGFGVRDKAVRFRRNVIVRPHIVRGGFFGDSRHSTSKAPALSRTIRLTERNELPCRPDENLDGIDSRAEGP